MTPGLCTGLAHGNSGVFTKGYDSCVSLDFRIHSADATKTAAQSNLGGLLMVGSGDDP